MFCYNDKVPERFSKQMFIRHGAFPRCGPKGYWTWPHGQKAAIIINLTAVKP